MTRFTTALLAVSAGIVTVTIGAAPAAASSGSGGDPPPGPVVRSTTSGQTMTDSGRLRLNQFVTGTHMRNGIIVVGGAPT